MSFPSYPATERQKRIVALAGELADVFAVRANENDWEGRFPYENYQDLRASGYLGLTVSQEFGGWGASVLEVTLAQARLAEGCASTALVTTMHLVMVRRMAIAGSGQYPLFERICRTIVEEGALINNAASEPAIGSPSRGGKPTTTARRQADGSWIINGRKTYTTGSSVLRYFLVRASVEDEAPPEAGLPPLQESVRNFLVERAMPGVRVAETWNSLSMRLSASHDLILENVCVKPGDDVELLEGYRPEAPAELAAWGLPLAGVYLGIAQGARNEAVRFAKRRRPNSLDQPISSVPHIQEKVAKMELALLQCKAVLYGLAEQFERDPTSIPGSQFAAAKYLITNHAAEVVDLAMRLVGGAGLSLTMPMQRYYRDIRAGFSNPPMDDVTLSLLSKQAFAEE